MYAAAIKNQVMRHLPQLCHCSQAGRSLAPTLPVIGNFSCNRRRILYGKNYTMSASSAAISGLSIRMTLSSDAP